MVPPPSEKAKQQAINNAIQSFDTYRPRQCKLGSNTSDHPCYGEGTQRSIQLQQRRK